MYADKCSDYDFFEDGRFFYLRSKFTKNTTFWFLRFLVINFISFIKTWKCIMHSEGARYKHDHIHNKIKQ